MHERATKKIVIDPGHGGTDPGTSGNGIVEKDYTLKISEYMKNRFDELGVENSITRTDDTTLSSTDRPKKAQSFYGTGNDVILISNHINAGGGDGAEIIYSLRNSDTLSKKIAAEFEKAGQNVRKYYQRRLPSNPSKDYYYILRDTPNNESIIVEYGFVDSTEDDVNQIKNNWQDLAEAVVKGVADYIGVPYTSNNVNENYYKVKSGDTLWSIARNYGLTVQELKDANNLKSNTLSIGQLIYIPLKETEIVEEEIYTVKSGDTLYSIASKYNTSISKLKRLNNLSSNTLSIGQKLKISSSSTSSETTYTVVKGDTLYGIANKFNTTVDNLKVLNNLSSNTLSIGQLLKIPSTNNNLTYTVKSGDTLYNIAKIYNTTVNEIKSLNNLSGNTLSIGQTLILPS